MKKFGLKNLLKGFSKITLALFVFASFLCCKHNAETSQEEKIIYSEKIAPYSYIGEEHEKQLRAVLDNENLQSEIEKSSETDINETFSNASDAMDFLLDNDFVSNDAAQYIENVMNAFEGESKSPVEIVNEITYIEECALNELEGSDLETVMCCAEIAKADFNVFCEYEDDWSVSRFSLKRFLKKVVCGVYSAILSAAAGFATGVILGGGNLAAGGIAAGVAAVGGAFSGFSNESFVIKISR